MGHWREERKEKEGGIKEKVGDDIREDIRGKIVEMKKEKGERREKREERIEEREERTVERRERMEERVD